jgi:hypothetical protein
MTASTPTEFKAVLDSNDLSNLPRDLSFHPVSNNSPQVLTIEQIEQFNRDGYVKGIRIYSDSEITSIRQYFDELLAKVVAAGGDSYSISSAHLKYGRVWDILTNAKIARSARPKCCRLGFAFLLQDAERWKERRLAPGLELLAIDTIESRDRVARG